MEQRTLLAHVERVDRQIVTPESTQIFVRLLMKRVCICLRRGRLLASAALSLSGSANC
jgi:hypothetical protein